MTLHKKTIIIISATLGVLMLVLYAASQFILLSSFETLEKKEVILNVERVLNALSNDIDTLGSTTADWASWDETYRFIEDMNSGYIESNLVDSMSIELKLNIIMFINSSEQIIFKRAFDYRNKEETPFPDIIIEHLSSNNLLMTHSGIKSKVDGIIMFSGSPMFISSRPILSSNDEGPVRGALIMGRYLNSEVIEHLSRTTHLSLTINDFHSPETLSDILPPLSSYSDEAPVITRPINKETIMGHTVVRDIYGKPAILISIDMARTIYNQGRTSLNYFVLFLLVTGLIFSIITRLLLEKQVLSRLARFSESIISIGREKNLTARVSISGSDELSALAKEFNKMIGALEDSEQKLFFANSKLELRVQNLRDEIAEREKLEKERERLIAELKEAISKVKTLKGLLPVCSSCGKIRDEKGNWTNVDVYIRDHSDAEITHGYCPNCEKLHFPQNFDE